MTNEGISRSIAPRNEIPNDLEGLRTWIEDEIGDEELLERIKAHPEFAEQFIEGNDLFAKDMLTILEEVREKNPEVAAMLIDRAIHHGRIIEPHIDRVIGTMDHKEADDSVRYIAMRATIEAHSKKVGEREKTDLELAMIAYSNEQIDRLRERHGLPPTPIHEEQIHMNRDKYVSLRGSAGDQPEWNRNIAYSRLDRQELGIGESQHADTKAKNIIHEFIHLKSYASFRAGPKLGQVELARAGLEVHSRRSPAQNVTPLFLQWMNEAVTEETACRMLAEISEDLPELGKVIHEAKNERDRIVDEFTKTDGDPGMPRYWITGAGHDENGRPDFVHSYKNERLELLELFDTLIAALPARYGTMDKSEAKEEIFTILQKAMFTGNLIPFARIMKEAFGARAFEKYARLNTTEDRKEFLQNRMKNGEYPETPQISLV